MPKAYDYDFRRKVLEAIELNGMTRSEASEAFGISRNTIHQWFKLRAETGDLQARPHNHFGHSHKIIDWDTFKTFVGTHSDKTQVQLAELWDDEISDRTISRALKRINFTRKKSYGYQERNEEQRVEFLAQLATVELESIVYADESGMDNRDQYDYGYNPKGERLFALKSGCRSGRVNMIAALCAGQLMAPFTVDGMCNRSIFEVWRETCLIPVLQPGQTLVIDNASFHKGGRIEELVKAAGCEVWYLPPYSPDLNPIEKCWSWIKSRIRKCLGEFDTLREAMENVLSIAS
ncbi:IS630 family transposase [Candidatus Synechococcus calcipolaris G9]|uniref:IS630 family transposase n=1 Tax=Candidatus Synechococcus calcipolaris G9 TaxID=1497997 RepID=A0ABT6EUX7_9SYNE|nr:IS630 family transposase [Candidatus Synechococcus calcipolaris]MDG2989639.1 IS630 family transposase [Candidatus Synechococcus calcipolaris G9]